MDEEIVILDADGNEHVFPAGMDPKVAAASVQRQITLAGLQAANAKPLQAATAPSTGQQFATNVLTDATQLISGLNPLKWPGMAADALRARQTQAGDDPGAFINPPQPGFVDTMSSLPTRAFDRPITTALQAAPIVPALLKGGKAAVQGIASVKDPIVDAAIRHGAGYVQGHRVGGVVGGTMGAIAPTTFQKLLDRLKGKMPGDVPVPEATGPATPSTLTKGGQPVASRGVNPGGVVDITSVTDDAANALAATPVNQASGRGLPAFEDTFQEIPLTGSKPLVRYGTDARRQAVSTTVPTPRETAPVSLDDLVQRGSVPAAIEPLPAHTPATPVTFQSLAQQLAPNYLDDVAAAQPRPGILRSDESVPGLIQELLNQLNPGGTARVTNVKQYPAPAGLDELAKALRQRQHIASGQRTQTNR